MSTYSSTTCLDALIHNSETHRSSPPGINRTCSKHLRKKWSPERNFTYHYHTNILIFSVLLHGVYLHKMHAPTQANTRWVYGSMYTKRANKNVAAAVFALGFYSQRMWFFPGGTHEVWPGALCCSQLSPSSFLMSSPFLHSLFHFWQWMKTKHQQQGNPQ